MVVATRRSALGDAVAAAAMSVLAPGTEGGLTVWDGEQTTIYEAATRAAEQGVPLCVLAGEEYGAGSSRDWAAKGPSLLGVRFVLARSYERIHRSNLVGMGILPLQFPDGESVASLGLTDQETFDLAPLRDGAATLEVTSSTGVAFDARVRIDAPNEWSYFRHGGILHFVLRQLSSRP
jgi:aconitate hydratase